MSSLQDMELISYTIGLTSSSDGLMLPCRNRPMTHKLFDRLAQNHPEKIPVSKVSDLLVTKQSLKGYEECDVSHIENVLKGETRGGEHISVSTIETATESESESATAAESEFASASRFEMARETEFFVNGDLRSTTSASASGKFGKLVQASASTELSVGLQTGFNQKTASKFARDVTQRAAKSISQKAAVRQAVTLSVSLALDEIWKSLLIFG